MARVESVVDATAHSANDGDLLRSALDGNLDGKLRVGVVLLARNAQTFNSIGDVLLTKGVKVAKDNVGRDAQATGSQVSRIGGNDKVALLGFFDNEVREYLSTRIDKYRFSS